MKTLMNIPALVLLILAFGVATLPAATRYVNIASTNPIPPYLTWATAATNIQDALDLTASSDTVLVARGAYAQGRRVVSYFNQARVVVPTSVTVVAVDGPAATSIWGEEGLGCVYLSPGAVLSGFTVTNGAPGSFREGAGILCADSSAVVTNCFVLGNTGMGSSEAGAIVHRGTLWNCIIEQNTVEPYRFYAVVSGATLYNCTIQRNRGNAVLNSTLFNCAIVENEGNGAGDSTLTHCTVTFNSGYGVIDGTLRNSIVYYNAGGNLHVGRVGDSGYAQSTRIGTVAYYTCTTPLPVLGSNNLTSEPEFLNPWRLSPNSALRGAGNPQWSSAVDLDGEPWATPPALGCDQPNVRPAAGPVLVELQASLTNVAVGYPVTLRAMVQGEASSNRWEFPGGSGVSDQLSVTKAFAVAGDVTITFRVYNDAHPQGISASLTIFVTEGVHYVNRNSVNPAPPYTSWATAATNIQDAVNVAAVAGALIIVTNGVYDSGIDVVAPGRATRLVITNELRVVSVNGPEVTVISGTSALRGVYLANKAVLSGFTVTNSVGGISSESWSAVVTNCVIIGNRGVNISDGGGISGGTVLNSAIVHNQVQNGGAGAVGSLLVGCLVASNNATALSSHLNSGGALNSVLINCRVIGNHLAPSGQESDSRGGGANRSTLINCEVVGNSAGYVGGGANESLLESCLVASNFTAFPGHSWIPEGLGGGGAFQSTLRNCRIVGNSSYIGAGVADSILENCIVSANKGIGMAAGTARNCSISGNSWFGVTLWFGWDFVRPRHPETILNNCTVVFNQGGGVYGVTVNNSIVYYNTDGFTEWNGRGTFNYSCTTPIPQRGVGNITAEPRLTDNFHLAADSPCRGAGSTEYASGTDIDGHPWTNPPSMGCDEFLAGLSGPLAVRISAAFTNAGTGHPLTFNALIDGFADGFAWDFGEGTIVSNTMVVDHAWNTAGNYTLTLRAFNLSYPEGVSTSVVIRVADPIHHYVSATSTSPVPPYTSWETAAATIQDAVDVAAPGSMVLVTNGVYSSGQRTLDTTPAIMSYGNYSNRVVVHSPIRLKSVNGPDVTIIAGYQPEPYTGSAEVRGVFLGHGASVSGFTLTNGSGSVGGILCASRKSIITNCVISGNAFGGVAGGTVIDSIIARNTRGSGAADCHLIRCLITDNRSDYSSGAGAASSVLDHCVLAGNLSDSDGGGAYESILNSCLVRTNTALGSGGGVSKSVLRDCVLEGNFAGSGGGAHGSASIKNCVFIGNSAGAGGGVYEGTLDSCVLANNTAYDGPGGGSWGTALNLCTVFGNVATYSGGGIFGGTLRNSIVVHNSVWSDTPEFANHSEVEEIRQTCTTPLPVGGVGNIEADPRFISTNLNALNLRLRSDSPCINVGDNSLVTSMFDLDGRPRIIGGTVDMGAYEFQPGAPGAFIGWLEQHGLSTSGEDDHRDPDGDRFDNFAEWHAGTDAFDAQSLLRLFPPQTAGSNVLVTWQSTSGRSYRLESASNLNSSASFQLLATVNAAGNGTVTTVVHTNAATNGPVFYRVLVTNPVE